MLRETFLVPWKDGIDQRRSTTLGRCFGNLWLADEDEGRKRNMVLNVVVHWRNTEITKECEN